MNKCNYCDFNYSDIDELGVHLNAKHFKCMCGTVFDIDEFGDDLIICKQCRSRREKKKVGDRVKDGLINRGYGTVIKREPLNIEPLGHFLVTVKWDDSIADSPFPGYDDNTSEECEDDLELIDDKI